MTTQLKVLFMAIPSRSNAYGETPVYCRLTYKLRQKRFMIGCTVPFNLWDQSKQRARGRSPKAEIVNQRTKLLLQKIYKAEAELLKRADPFEVEDIIAYIQGGNKASCRTLMQLYQYTNAINEKRLPVLARFHRKQSPIRH
jgi:integrase/recombinase XerD